MLSGVKLHRSEKPTEAAGAAPVGFQLIWTICSPLRTRSRKLRVFRIKAYSAEDSELSSLSSGVEEVPFFVVSVNIDGL